MNQDFHVFSRQLFNLASDARPRLDFLRQSSLMILHLVGCDEIELRLRDGILAYGWRFRQRPREISAFNLLQSVRNSDGKFIPTSQENSILERLCRDVLSGGVVSNSPFVTAHGSFWTGDTQAALDFYSTKKQPAHLSLGGDDKSIALIPFTVNDNDYGILLLKSHEREFFTPAKIEFSESIAQIFGIAVAVRRAHVSLRERGKELACLYGIMELVIRPHLALDDLLQKIAHLLPPAMQHPEIAASRIRLDQRAYGTNNFRDSRVKLAADILVGGKRRGKVEVVYGKEQPDAESEIFLEEEQILIEAVAKHVALIIERWQVESDRSRLQHQLQHADRLATIGQLAAGVAHELNEPLANILGFAQLAKKSSGLSAQTEQDIEKIVTSSLYAREVIKKLLTFARQMPSTKKQANVNQIVEDGLYFLESRCAKQGIQLIRDLMPDLPDLVADATQLQQVLVNLVVNSLHAMPNGGRMTIRTFADDSQVSLVVEDTGTGMTEEVKSKLFAPFFTTKEVGQGTGLGLAVVHGIVLSHGGSINVESEVGRGTSFEIKLPIVEPLENQSVD